MLGISDARSAVSFAAHGALGAPAPEETAGLAAKDEAAPVEDALTALLKEMGVIYDPLKPCGCERCARRKYMDGSTDPGVSFKAPTHIAPELSRAVVASHEAEHVTRNSAEARRLELKVTQSSVRLFTRRCPECGTIYTSGGVTRTAYRPDVPAYKLLGSRVDTSL